MTVPKYHAFGQVNMIPLKLSITARHDLALYLYEGEKTFETRNKKMKHLDIQITSNLFFC